METGPLLSPQPAPISSCSGQARVLQAAATRCSWKRLQRQVPGRRAGSPSLRGAAHAALGARALSEAPVPPGPRPGHEVSSADSPCLDCSIKSQIFGSLTPYNFQGNFSPRAFVPDH